jgi:hypothetical protein
VSDYPEKIYATEKVGTNGIHCLDYRNFDDDVEYVIVKPKRKPLPDGRLPMTDSEKIEFLKVVWPDIHESLKVDFVKVQVDEIIMRYGDMDMFTMTTVWNYKAILYLAQRFELTEV